MAIINMDVDGVVCDFAPHLFSTLEADGFSFKDISPDIYKVWDIFAHMPADMKAHTFDLLSDVTYWKNIPVISGAKEGIELLRDAGHRIHWITSSWKGCFGWADVRREWLGSNFLHKDQNLLLDLTIAGDKSFSDADVYVDDKAASISGWLHHFTGRKHQAVLYKNSHNVHDWDKFSYVNNWENGLATLINELAVDKCTL